MNKYLSFLRRHIFAELLVLILVIIGTFFFIKYPYNTSKTFYQATITYEGEGEADFGEIGSELFLSRLRKEDGTYSYDTFSPVDFFNDKDTWFEINENTLVIEGSSEYFIADSSSISADDASYKRFYNVLNLIFNSEKKRNPNPGYKVTDTMIVDKGTVDPIVVTIIAGCGFIFLELALCFGLSRLVKENNTNVDNIELFDSIFHKEYWKKASFGFTKIKVFDLCFIAILFALQMILKLVTIPSGFPSLNIGINYLVFATISLIYGPIWGVIIGALSDILGFFIFPSTGVFNILYTTQAMLSGLVYGIFLYRKKFSFVNCLWTRIIINILLNALYGTILWGMPSVAAFTSFEQYKVFFLFFSLPKNIIYLLPQSFLLYLFLKLVLPVLKRTRRIPEGIIETAK